MNNNTLMQCLRSRLSMLVVMLTLGLANAFADNTLSLAMEGNTIVPGEEKEVSVLLTNSEPVSALQFDVVLPNGLEYVKNSMMKVNDRITKTSHDVKVGAVDGDVRFVRFAIFPNAVDITASGIKGSEGAILTFKVKAAAEFLQGDIRLAEITGTDATVPMPVEVEIAAELLTVTANPGSFSLSESELMLSAFKPAAVDFNLGNIITAVSLQADIILPEGVSFAKNEDGDAVLALSDRVSENVRIGMSKLADGGYRVIIASLTNDEFDANEGALFTFSLVADGAFEGTQAVEVKNVKISDKQGNAFGVEGEGVVSVVYAGPRGDVNHDGVVDIDDVYCVIAATNAEQPDIDCDLNGDEVVDIDDIYEVINEMDAQE